MTCPCRGCPDRRPACHDRCEAYQSWRDERRAMKQAIVGEDLSRRETYDGMRRAIDSKAKRRRRGRKT